MSKHHVYFDLLNALDQPGCPICRLAQKMTDNYLGSLLHEMVLDVDLRDRLREAHGFCREHAWQLVPHRDGLGTAIIYRDVLNSVLKKMESLRFEEASPLSVARLKATLRPHSPNPATHRAVGNLLPTHGCLACTTYADMEEVYLSSLLEHISTDNLREAYQRSSGICLPHLRRALQLVRCEETLRKLLDLQRPLWESLRAELDEFVRKHDYRFTREGFDEERDSWIRALEAIAGRDKPYFPKARPDQKG